MGIMDRLGRVVRGWFDPARRGVEDPDQVLQASLENQLAMLQQAKRSIVEVTTARRRLELQVARRRDDARALEERARRELEQGSEDAARSALQRKHLVLTQVRELETQVAELAEEEQRLGDAEARLSTQVEGFRTRAQVLRARHSSASAQVRIGESAAGLSNETAAVGAAMRHAEERTRELQAKADALQEMADEGLTTGDAAAAFDKRLASLDADDAAESELTALKRQVQQGELPPASEQR